MSLFENNKAALLRLASGDVSAEERQRLERLVQSDTECRSYWNSLTSTIQQLEVDATSSQNNLPPQFHAILTGRLRHVSRSDAGTFARFHPSIPKLALFSLLLFAAVLATRFKPSPAPTTALKQSTSFPAKTQTVVQVSWAALRHATPSALPSHSPKAPVNRPSRPLSMAWSERADWIRELDL